MSKQEYPRGKIQIDPLPYPFRDNQYTVFCEAEEKEGLTTADCLWIQIRTFRQKNITIRCNISPEVGKRCKYDQLIGVDTGISQCDYQGVLYTNSFVSPEEFEAFTNNPLNF